MGALTTALLPILQIGSAIGGVASLGKTLASNSVSDKQLRASNALSEEQAAQRAAIERQQNQLQLLKDETDRKSALKRAVARQRAIFGGQGIGLEGGSSEAVLLGMFDESGLDGDYNRQQSALRNSAANLSLSQMQQKNLLAESNAREKNNLKYLTDVF